MCYLYSLIVISQYALFFHFWLQIIDWFCKICHDDIGTLIDSPPSIKFSLFKFFTNRGILQTAIGYSILTLLNIFSYAKFNINSRSAIEGEKILNEQQIILCGKNEMVIFIIFGISL